MKFRHLKKKQFKMCFDWFQTDTDDPHVIVSYDGNKLSATYEWEYDNGLYLGNSENKYLVLVDTKSEDILDFTINNKCKCFLKILFLFFKSQFANI